MFVSSCRSGNLQLCKWLYEISKKQINMQNDSAFKYSCGSMNVELSKWIYQLGLEIKSPVNIDEIYEKCVENSCINGDLQTFLWLFNMKKKIDSKTLLIIIKQCFKLGHFELCKYFYKYIDGAIDAILDNSDELLFSSCTNGYLELSKWLYDLVLQETERSIDVNKYDDRLFRWSCRNGHLEISKWLYEKSKKRKIPINIHSQCDYAFRRSCKNGYLEMAKWIYELSQSLNKPIDIFSCDYYAFRWSCCYGHLEVAKWLHNLSCKRYYDSYYITCDHYAFKSSCIYNHIKIAEWLIEVNELDIHRKYDYIIKKKYNKIYKWEVIRRV